MVGVHLLRRILSLWTTLGGRESNSKTERHSEIHTHTHKQTGRDRGNEAGIGPILEGSRLKPSHFFSFMMKPMQQDDVILSAKSLQSCLTLCDPVDCIPPGSYVHGIYQARILEWVAISFSRGSS